MQFQFVWTLDRRWMQYRWHGLPTYCEDSQLESGNILLHHIIFGTELSGNSKLSWYTYIHTVYSIIGQVNK